MKRRNFKEVKKAIDSGEFPNSINTVYRWHHVKRYPALIFKVGGKLMIDMDEWERMCERAIQKQIDTVRRVRSTV